MHPYDGLRVIATPREALLHCETPARYARAQAYHLHATKRRFPTLDLTVHEAPDGAVAYIIGGKWIVGCPCGDAPIASPDWDEARCFGCGAVYRRLQWPARRAEIERVLLRRPAAVTRNYLPGESVEHLIRENTEHGVR